MNTSINKQLEKVWNKLSFSGMHCETINLFVTGQDGSSIYWKRALRLGKDHFYIGRVIVEIFNRKM
jgi:hypothetical protein